MNQKTNRPNARKLLIFGYMQKVQMEICKKRRECYEFRELHRIMKFVKATWVITTSQIIV